MTSSNALLENLFALSYQNAGRAGLLTYENFERVPTW